MPSGPGDIRNMERSLLRPVLVAQDDNGSLLITCPDLPEVATFAETPADIVRRANAAIEEALAARIS